MVPRVRRGDRVGLSSFQVRRNFKIQTLFCLRSSFDLKDGRILLGIRDYTKFGIIADDHQLSTGLMDVTRKQ